MKKIFLSTTIPEAKNAGSKARTDVLQILENNGYESVYFPRFSNLSELTSFWKNLSEKIEKDSHIVLEYPCIPRKRLWVLFVISFLKRIKIYAVIHDISDLRFVEVKKNSDMPFLKRFDGLISHNAFMTSWLRKMGYAKPVVDLEVFDYCLTSSKSFHEQNLNGRLKLLYAGNLSFDKATYLYDKNLDHLENVDFCVYGQSFDKERMNGSQIQYKGVFNPDSPELPENYHFGLIWEGTSTTSCTGQMGQYIRFNNPHKFSLYLSLGLPVIVWKEAAVAKFVEKYQLGVTIENLQELPGILERVSPGDYRNYLSNIEAIGSKIRKGEFLKTALKKLLTD